MSADIYGSCNSNTLPILNRDESLYDSPTEFRLERFIENPALEKWQMSFGKGTRRRLGENLAVSELYIVTAMLFRKYDVYKGRRIGTGDWKEDGLEGQKGPTLGLYETEREDIEMASSIVLPWLKEGREGVRVRVRN